MACMCRDHMEELRCVLAVIRHGDRTPKQKMKMKVTQVRDSTLPCSFGRRNFLLPEKGIVKDTSQPHCSMWGEAGVRIRILWQPASLNRTAYLHHPQICIRRHFACLRSIWAA